MEQELLNEYEMRISKTEKIKEKDGVVYKDKFDRTHTLEQSMELAENEKLAVCGRVVAKRVFGKLMFLKLYDVNGSIQISLSTNELGEDFEYFKQNIDVADFIGVTGEIYFTKVGEKTVRGHAAVILSKTLRPLPEKFHGISDSEARYRQRYLDVISNEESRETLKTRIKVTQTIREFLTKNDFVEVETPILQNVASGANARPFVTHHNTLDEDFYLRIAPELFLKEVIACGFDRVFELGKNFRNEGMDASHLQEFTMLEWYAAYWDYNDNINFITKLLEEIIMKVKGTLIFDYQGVEINFTEIKRLDYIKELSELMGTNILDFKNTEDMKKVLKEKELFNKEELDEVTSIPAAVDLLFKKKIRPSLIVPTILYNYPTYMIPLARHNDKDARAIDMFQLVVNGWEVVKCYSELVDPIAQRNAFTEQVENKEAGDEEAMDVDEDFILAMEHGMPPMSGLGLGIDRIVSLLTDQPTLRDVIFFPQMKNKNK